VTDENEAERPMDKAIHLPEPDMDEVLPEPNLPDEKGPTPSQPNYA
jgi:hypothetical protein